MTPTGFPSKTPPVKRSGFDVVTRNKLYLDRTGYSELADGTIQLTPARLTLTERDQIDPQLLEVISVIKGNVDLRSGHLRLPALREIDGKLLVRGEASVDFPKLEIVGSSLSLMSDANARIALPALREVGGSAAVGPDIGTLEKIIWIGGDLERYPRDETYDKLRMPELIILAGGIHGVYDIPFSGVVLEARKLRAARILNDVQDHIETGILESHNRIQFEFQRAKLRERLAYWQRHDQLMERVLAEAVGNKLDDEDQAPTDEMSMGI